MGRVLRICRRGFFRVPAFAAVALVVATPFLLGNFWASPGASPGGPGPLTCCITRGEFLHVVSAKGAVESAANAEVRCEVRAHHGSWLRILEVVPEGTYVEPGDFLIQLDSSGLETERNQQQIVCEQARAEVAHFLSACEAAEIAERDYMEGEYSLSRREADLAVFVAQDRLRRAEQSVEAGRRLEARGYLTAQQLRADEFALETARTELRMAEARLRVLENCTKRRRLTQLQSAVAAGRAQLAAAEANLKLNDQRLAEIDDQIRKCTIRAPVPGTVVLAHMFHNDHSHMVEPGESTMEGRVLVRLPDFRHMQVRAKIEEDKIAHVKPGLPAAIRLEGFPDVALCGRVVAINEYPEAEDWHGSDIKQYKTTIAIETPLEDMRPGMTAELRVCVRRLDSELQVPSQAVLRHGGKAYCISVDRDRWEAHEVSLGPSNGISTVVRGSLEEGQRVVLTPASCRDKVSLPEPPDKYETLLPSARSGPDRMAQLH